MKYIITKQNDAIIFSDGMVHADVARKFGGAKSAGFVSIDDEGKIAAYGRSMSLGLESDPDDSRIISNAFNRY